jgi:two-component system, NarL family, invasion response regulator UvrY
MQQKPAGSHMPRILVVDDHPVVREGVGRVLASALPDVVLGAAADAASARECMREPWNLVILDLTLGNDDGLHLLRWMRESHGNVPVLVVSMHAPEEFARRTVKAGAAGYVSKDSPPHELVHAVTSVLAGEAYVPLHGGDERSVDSTRLPHERLSDREYQVLRMIGQARTVSEIAAELSLSVKTVSTYRSRILDKMNLRTSAELMRYVIAHRLVPWEPI